MAAALPFAELTAMAERSHRLERRAVELAGHPEADPVDQLVRLAAGDRVVAALALSYAFRHRERHPEDGRLAVAARLLARALDGLRATSP